MAILIIVVAFLVLTPLALMILNSFQTARPGQPIVWGLEGWVKAFTTPGIIKAITNTFSLAITRQAIALLIGSFFAWLIARTDLPMKGTLEFFFWLSFFLPALPETMGWILLLDPKYGLLNQGLIDIGVLSQPIFNIYSFWGIVWAHLGGTVSVKVMLLAPAFRNLGRGARRGVAHFRRQRYADFFPHRPAGDDAGYFSHDHIGYCPLS